MSARLSLSNRRHLDEGAGKEDRHQQHLQEQQQEQQQQQQQQHDDAVDDVSPAPPKAVRVAIRIRPLLEPEAAHTHGRLTLDSSSHVSLTTGSERKTFHFDHAFGAADSQEDVFDYCLLVRTPPLMIIAPLSSNPPLMT